MSRAAERNVLAATEKKAEDAERQRIEKILKPRRPGGERWNDKDTPRHNHTKKQSSSQTPTPRKLEPISASTEASLSSSTNSAAGAGHTALPRRRGDEDIQLLPDGSVRTEYLKRLRDTREMRNKVQTHLETVNQEARAATGTRDTLLEMMNQLQRPLILTKQWMEVRARQDAFEDLVGASLKQSVHEVKESVTTLNALLNSIEAVLADLRAAQARYQVEIDNKDMVILLDKACMDDALTQPAIPGPPSHNDASIAKSPRVPRLPSTLMQTTSLKSESDWRNATTVSISKGVASVASSKAIRKKIAKVVETFQLTGKTKRPVCVVDALQQRLKSNLAQCGTLELNTKMYQGEILAIAKQKATLNGSLEKVHQQLSTAEKRLAVGVVKPSGEAMRQGVEEVLEIEVVRMKETESDLVKQLKDLEKKEVRFQGSLKETKKEIGEKHGAINLDKKCVLMELPEVLPTPPRSQVGTRSEPRTPASATSSQRSAAKPYVPPPPSGSTTKVPQMTPRNTPRKK